MVVGRILGMAGKALAKKFLSKKLGKKTYLQGVKKRIKSDPDAPTVAAAGTAGAGALGYQYYKKHKKKQD
ncbi:MAG: hypothetical protein V1244_00510, partial [Nitrospinaceae bacterium]|nr:hypothetical protein [Nitrospinaceae bacterium]